MANLSKNSAGNSAAAVWIYGPWLDLTVGCGAWSVLLLLISYFSVASSARAWSVAFYGLALFFNYPHYMATIYRAYHREEDFHKYRIFTVHITALIVLTILLSHLWAGILPWIFTVYLTWSPWHYSGQNYGIFMMFARRAGAQPSERTRRALYGAFIASYLILFLGFHTGRSTDSLFYSLNIPAVVSRWEQGILGVAFIALSGYGLSRLARDTGWRKLIPSLTLFSSQFLWFLLPSTISLFKGWAIPQSRYSSGVLAVMHSAQYLWITSYYARREAGGESDRNWRPWAYFAILIAGGIALFVPGPWLASSLFHRDFTASFLIFTALINVHHFILDGAIWKLRDGRIASLLLNSRAKISDAAAGTGNTLSQAWRWLTGNTGGAHYCRVSVALLLLAWGSVDQFRYYLAMHSDSLSDLQHAARLNSFDSSLQMRLAQREFDSGQPQQAEVAWKKAIEANPRDPAPRQALLRFLLENNRFDEAFQLTQSALKIWPQDSNLLVDRGLLLLRRGKSDEALADWKQALALDPSKATVHLYVAYELDRENQAADAAEQYNAFLRKVARQPVQNRPPPDKLIAVILRMADCQARAAQPEQALKSYHLAETLAVETKQVKLESVAYVNEAALQSKGGKVSDALALYQAALRLDNGIGDQRAEALDWAAFGQFLHQAGFSPRLAYACLVNAERLTKTLPDASNEMVTRSRKEIEAHLGSGAAALSRNPEPALQEALAMRR